MKYLKDKNSRRRGVAIELAIGMLLIMVAMSTIIVVTTMIQIEKQKNSVNNLDDLFSEIEIMEYDQIGSYFKELVVEEVANLQSNSEEDPLNHLTYVDLTSSKDNRLDENHVYNIALKSFKDNIISSLKEELNQKFAVLAKERNLVFTVDIDYTITETLTKEQSLENGDRITIEKTYDFEYNLTFTLTVDMVYGENIKYTEFIASFNSVLSQTVVYSSTYLRLYNSIPVEEEVTYNFEVQPIEISIKAGHYIKLSAKSNNIILETKDLDTKYYKISGGDRDQKIIIKEEAQGQILEIEVEYKKLIVQSGTPAVTAEETEENENFEVKKLKLRITVEQENNEENQQPTDVAINVNSNNILLLSDAVEGGSSTPVDGENSQTPATPEQVVNDITIIKLTGYNKEYTGEIGEKVPGSDVYEYQVSSKKEQLDNTHWEYK